MTKCEKSKRSEYFLNALYARIDLCVHLPHPLSCVSPQDRWHEWGQAAWTPPHTPEAGSPPPAQG